MHHSIGHIEEVASRSRQQVGHDEQEVHIWEEVADGPILEVA